MPEPIIAIVGRPNVGKSTLFNRLSRSRNALVDNRPGITRDRIHATVMLDGVRCTLVDTGGFDDLGQDPLLDKVRLQVEQAIQEADCIIFLVDGRQGVIPGDQEMAAILRRSRKPYYLAVNKIDGPEVEHLANEFFSLGKDAVHPISAAHGYGLPTFMEVLARDLAPLEAEEPATSAEHKAVRVAVVGKPNVGKSSLINRILGAERMVVSELPGTTRDAVDTEFSLAGRDYILIDTAGIRRRARVKEKIETFSVIKALKRLEKCDIGLLLLDAATGIAEQDARIAGYALEKSKGLVLVVNKWDLIKHDSERQTALNREIDRLLSFVAFAPRINVSAATGDRVLKIFRRVDMVYAEFSRRFNTAAVNSALQELVKAHPPPRVGRGHVKFLYATQLGAGPPTFVVFASRPEMIHTAYERYLNNGLRERLGLRHTPIRLVFRAR